MKKTITLCMLALSFCAFSQSKNEQFSLEGGYGASIPVARFSDFRHYEFAFRYMADEQWGFKFDFGSDKFRKKDVPNYGSDYFRVSAQVVNNLARTFNLKYHSDTRFNLLAHAGLGYSNMKSQRYPGQDNIVHIIFGVTPQIKITDRVAFYFDSSFIMNFSQDYDYNGARYKNETDPPSVGKLLNLSAGLVFYLGKNQGDSDWR
ncbi:hypothetical protein FUA48_07895 [Flavobacterium alkalisoli]|uniref:Porin family protein n=1 Tax=Flavobacterium alkalisoli TaxID=2602769 RepID=A0A5B9FTW1_9FLAO|nr:hypothetical protein [Flavobacterium alkalisoli]QEE49506.1 hypothetical protein FUA48_07895 [Flavobacterium alkalisoli]